MVNSRRLANGEVEEIDPHPPACTVCGMVPEFIIEIVAPYEPNPEPDAERG